MGWMVKKVGIVKEIIEREIRHTTDYHMETFIFELENEKEQIICKFIPEIKVGYRVEVIGNYSDWYKMFLAKSVRWLNPQTKLTKFQT